VPREYTIAKVLAIWTIVIVLFTLLLQRGKIARLKSPFWYLFAAFLFLNLLATLFSEFPATAFRGMYELLVGMVFFPLALFFVARRGYEKTFISVMLWGGLLNYTLFILEFAFDIKIFWGAGPVFEKDVMKPAYSLPGWYSSFFGYMLPFVVHRFFFSKSILKKVFYIVCFILCVSGVVYIGSRQASLVVAVVLLITLFQYLKFIKPRLMGFLVGALFAGIVVFLVLTPSSFWDYMKTVTDTKTDGSISRRVSYLQAALELIADRPLLGSGTDTFRDYYARSYAVRYAPDLSDVQNVEQEYRRVAHNTYLEVLVGSGVLGMGVFLGIVYLALKKFKVSVRNFHDQGDVKNALLASTYRTVFIASLLFFLFSSDLGSKLFWMFLALSQISLKLSRKDAAQE